MLIEDTNLLAKYEKNEVNEKSPEAETELERYDLIIDTTQEQPPLDDNDNTETHDNGHPTTFDLAYLDTITGEEETGSH